MSHEADTVSQIADSQVGFQSGLRANIECARVLTRHPAEALAVEFAECRSQFWKVSAEIVWIVSRFQLVEPVKPI
jgi:hypothetical protein